MQQFISWWQHLPERIDPVFFEWGAFQIRYYGLMYLLSFLVFYALVAYRIKTEKSSLTKDRLDDFITWAIVGVLIGARLGYVVFYDPVYFLAHPLEIFWPLHRVNGELAFGISGLSYHGGLIGGIIASYLFCKRNDLDVLTFADFIIPAVPLGYMFGRLGNFLNNELYGRVTEKWWGMYFVHAPSGQLRHPSQLYEALFEGLFLFAVLWPLRKTHMFKGGLFFIYIIGYGVVRFIIEFFRSPDSHLGFVMGPLSMGQLLCLLMVLGGIIGIVQCKTKSTTS